MKLSLGLRKRLNNGDKMPLIGLGVSGIEPLENTVKVVQWALESGYRHVDTAKLYKNESFVGSAIRKSGISRKDIWITTKLWPTDFSHPKKALEASLKKLNMDYVDLYLVHWPTPVEIPGFEKKLWKAMEGLAEAGLCKSIGVSNYQVQRLQKILAVANIPPAVNQVRCSPLTYPAELHEFCKKNDIAMKGYGPLTQGSNLQNKALMSLAKKYERTVAQILLRWALQNDIIVIPKTQNKERIHQNIMLYDFDLSASDMQILDSLGGATI